MKSSNYFEDIHSIDGKEHMTIKYTQTDVNAIVAGNPIKKRVYYNEDTKDTKQFEGPNKANEDKVFIVNKVQMEDRIKASAKAKNVVRNAENPDEIIVPEPEKVHDLVLKKDIDVSVNNGFAMATNLPSTLIGGSGTDMWDSQNNNGNTINGSFVVGGEYANMLDDLADKIKGDKSIKSINIDIILKQSPSGGQYNTEAMDNFIRPAVLEQTKKYLREIKGITIPITGSSDYKAEAGKSTVNIQAKH